MKTFPLDVFNGLEVGNMFEYGKLLPISDKKLMWTVVSVERDEKNGGNRRVELEVDFEGVPVGSLVGTRIEGGVSWKE